MRVFKELCIFIIIIGLILGCDKGYRMCYSKGRLLKILEKKLTYNTFMV